MAQHDYVIANGTGAAVRSDLNAGFAAIVSQNSGATAPSTTYAYQSWADTTAGVMKMRNGANNAWITLYQLDGEWSTIAFENGTAAAPSIYFKDSGTDTGIYSPGADQVAISTGGTGRVFVSSNGNLLIGTTTNTARLTTASPGAEGTVEVSLLSGGCEFFVNGAGGGNAAACVQRIGSNTATSRAINTGGTVNALGTDYAEYMTKAGNFIIAKGDICGITVDGLITNVFANAISFVVKSTNPSYVGGDTWGTGFDEDPEGLEVARQTVDRIAFAGQVPVNVTDATPGQYIVPVVANDGGIAGIAKDEADLTLPEYMRAVGKVIAIEGDGRARIIVKVA